MIKSNSNFDEIACGGDAVVGVSIGILLVLNVVVFVIKAVVVMFR